VREASATGIHADLRDRATDFAVAPRLGAPEDLTHVPVLADRFVAVLPAGLVAGDRPVALAELARHPQLAQMAGTAVRARVEAAFSAAGLDYRPSIVVAHHHTVLRMVRARLGVSLLPSICLQGEPRDGLAIRNVRGRAIVREICIVTRRGAVLSPAAAACAEAIAEALRPREGA
jgi:DNA-binding transcriptional LysR family regulator